MVILASAAVRCWSAWPGYRLSGRGSVIALSTAAGLGFGGVAIASREMGADAVDLALLANPLLWAVVAYGALAIGFFSVALQRGTVTVVGRHLRDRARGAFCARPAAVR